MCFFFLFSTTLFSADSDPSTSLCLFLQLYIENMVMDGWMHACSYREGGGRGGGKREERGEMNSIKKHHHGLTFLQHHE